jgi:hypothetical protein
MGKLILITMAVFVVYNLILLYSGVYYASDLPVSKAVIIVPNVLLIGWPVIVGTYQTVIRKKHGNGS